MCKPPRQLILLNSRDRISGSIQAGTYNTAVVTDLVSQVRLENFVILNAFLTINASNNTFTVTETVVGADTFSITPGTYDTAQFVAEISALLAGSGVLANIYTVTISATDLSLTLTASGGALDTFALSWGTAGYVMGWGTSPTATAAALTHTSPFAVQLGNLNKLLIRLAAPSGGDMVWSSSNATASFVVDINVNFGSYFSYVPQIDNINVAVYPQPVNVRQIKIELFDAATGGLVDPRGCEFQIELAFWVDCGK